MFVDVIINVLLVSIKSYFLREQGVSSMKKFSSRIINVKMSSSER
jgi:hypothetical protein